MWGQTIFPGSRHLSRTCIYVVLYIYSVLFLLFYIVYRKKKSFLFLPKGRAFVTMQNGWNNRISDGCVIRTNTQRFRYAPGHLFEP